jgi:hypothetical protein
LVNSVASALPLSLARYLRRDSASQHQSGTGVAQAMGSEPRQTQLDRVLGQQIKQFAEIGFGLGLLCAL